MKTPMTSNESNPESLIYLRNSPELLQDSPDPAIAAARLKAAEVFAFHLAVTLVEVVTSSRKSRFYSPEQDGVPLGFYVWSISEGVGLIRATTIDQSYAMRAAGKDNEKAGS